MDHFLTGKSSYDTQHDYEDMYEQIRLLNVSDADRIRKLANLVAQSTYVKRLATIVWKSGSGQFELFEELLSLTFLKFSAIRNFPPVNRSGIAGYTFMALSKNWITVVTTHKKQFSAAPFSHFPDFDEIEFRVTRHAGIEESGYCVPLEEGRIANITPSTLYKAIATLTKADPIYGVCMNLKLHGVAEHAIAKNLGKTFHQTRGHIRCAKQALRIILAPMETK